MQSTRVMFTPPFNAINSDAKIQYPTLEMMIYKLWKLTLWGFWIIIIQNAEWIPKVHTISIIKCPKKYVSLQLRMQNRRKKWNFLLNFWNMRKLSECYSRIFQTQSSGCASGVDHFRNFTKLKILNIWIVKYLLNCKIYLSYNFRIFQKITECWVLENLDVHLERTTSELEFKSEKSKIVTFSLEFNGQVLVRQD